MSVSVAEIYECRGCPKIPLPRSVQDNIAKLRITPVAYKPFRPAQRHVTFKASRQSSLPDNWRIAAISNYVSKVREKDDPDYFDIFQILNKVAPATLEKLVGDAIEIIKKRDHEFRLRVATLLFNKAITEHMYASVMADCAVKFVGEFPDMREDISVQVEMFTKLYDLNETLTYPSIDNPNYDNLVISWMKQKDKRRGYAKFMTQLFVRNLVDESVLKTSLDDVIHELGVLAHQPKSEQTEENATQFVDFLFECAKVLPKTSSLKTLIHSSGRQILAIPRPEVPSLCMRSRFKLEDAVKCVQ